MQVEVRVTKGGAPVEGLTAADFVLRDQGAEQRITSVEYVPPVSEWSDNGPRAHTAHIYIATESNPDNDVVPAIHGHLQQVLIRPWPSGLSELPPGIKISLLGLPFTTDPESFAAILPAATRAALITDRGWADRLPAGIDATQVRFDWIQNRLFALPRYLDLVDQLGRLPGKKIVVLIRDHFYPDQSMNELLDELAAQAFRHRVTFHAAVTNMPLLEVGERRESTLEDIVRLSDGRLREGTLRNFEYSRRRQSEIEALSENGRVRFSGWPLMREAVESAGGYYLLTYTPNPDTNSARYRPLEIAVTRTNVRATAIPGYYSPTLGATSRQRIALSMYNALGSADTPAVPLRVGFAVSPKSPTGTPIVAASVNFAPSTMTMLRTNSGLTTEMEIWARALDLDGMHLPYYRVLSYQESLTEREWERLRADPQSSLQINLGMRLAPSRYRWQLACWEKTSGRLGAFEKELEVPDVQDPSSPSDMVLSLEYVDFEPQRPARLGPRPADDRMPLYKRVRAYEKNRSSAPVPDGVFRQGEVIVAGYAVGQASKEDYQSSNKLRIHVLPADGADPVWEDKLPIRSAVERIEWLSFQARIPTADLEPGRYRVRADLPAGARKRQPYIEQEFTVVRE